MNSYSSFFLVRDNLDMSFVGKPSKYGKNSQPQVYWTYGRANAVRKHHQRYEKSDPNRYEVIEIELQEALMF